MIWRQAGMCVLGFGAGILVSAGVFTVLLAVGLVPRFAGRTHTGRHIFLYEDLIVWGPLTGVFFSIFPGYGQIGAWIRTRLFFGAVTVSAWKWLSGAAVSLGGLFSGIFVGSLALAIAEMLDSVPIFTRRIGLGRGLKSLIWGVALGKLAGSLFYFAFHFYETGF